LIPISLSHSSSLVVTGVPVKLDAGVADQYVDGSVLMNDRISGLRDFLADAYVAAEELADTAIVGDRGSTLWPCVAINIEDRN